MTYSYFYVEDANMHYKVFGEGEPLVLFHGFTGSSNTWEQCVQEF